MSPALANSLDNERFLTRLLYLLGQPTQEMIEAGKSAIRESCVTEYVGATAPKDIFTTMAEIAIAEAENG